MALLQALSTGAPVMAAETAAAAPKQPDLHELKVQEVEKRNTETLNKCAARLLLQGLAEFGPLCGR